VEMKYDRPSQIQATAIPAILANPVQNFIGQAQSGSGKTAAFSLSILSRIDERLRDLQAIIVAPTRELTRQIYDNVVSLAKHTQIQSLCVLKNTKLSRPIYQQVIVSTPGSILHAIEKKYVDTKYVRIFVLDEADELLRLQQGGNQSEKILKRLPESCQICLFSATFNEMVREFANKIIKSPKIKILIPPEKLSLDKLSQYYIKCKNEQHKLEVLDKIFGNVSVGQTIIFVHTREKARYLYHFMKEKGHEISVLHGEMLEDERDTTMDNFRVGANRVLISTNLLARGLDVLKVSLVINFDVPMDKNNRADPETYLHRIGRSARWKNPGLAISFVHDRESDDKLKEIAGRYNKIIKELSADQLEMVAQMLEQMGIV